MLQSSVMGSISYTDIHENSNAPCYKDINNHGQRLLPHVIDHTADVNPDLVIGLTAKPSASPSTPYEFTQLTISQFADAVNYMAHWLDSILGKGSKQVIGFIGLQVSPYFPSKSPINAGTFYVANCRNWIY